MSNEQHKVKDLLKFEDLNRYYFNSLDEAYTVLAYIRGVALAHVAVSVADYLDAVGVEAEWLYNSVGWTYDELIHVKPIKDEPFVGWYIDLPTPLYVTKSTGVN